MKKRIGLIFLCLLVLVGIFISLGFNDSQVQKIQIDSKAFDQVPPPLKEGPMLERAREKIGFDKNIKTDEKRLKMNITSKKVNDSNSLEVEGNGLLKIGNNSYNFQLNEERSYLNQLNNEDKAVLVGLIIGEIKNKKGNIEELTIDFTYYPETQQGQFGVVIGTVGDEIMMPFGEPIMDEKLVKVIDKAFNKQ